VFIAKINCHQAVLRGLVDACAVLHRDVCPITSVAIA